MSVYQLQHSDGSLSPISIAPLTVDQTSTSLSFWGRGIPNFGELEQTNFLKLLENFASQTAPVNPVIGQLWYDKLNFILYVFVGETEQWRNVGADAVSTGTVGPLNPNAGDLWYNTDNGILYVYYNGWNIPPAVCIISDQMPPNPVLGQLWYDNTNMILNICIDEITGSWQPVYAPSPQSISLDYLAFVV
jgi:hypothetical protein